MNNYEVCFIDTPFKYVVACEDQLIAMTTHQWINNCLGITYEDVGFKHDSIATYLVSEYKFGGVHVRLKHRFTPSVLKRVLNNTPTVKLLEQDATRVYRPLRNHVGYSRTGMGHDEFVFFHHCVYGNKNTKHIPCPNLDEILVVTQHQHVVKSFHSVKRYATASHLFGKKLTELCSKLKLPAVINGL